MSKCKTPYESYECFHEACRKQPCPKVRRPPPLPCPYEDQEPIPLIERTCCGPSRRCVVTRHQTNEEEQNSGPTELYASCGILPFLPPQMGGPRRATVDEVRNVVRDL